MNEVPTMLLNNGFDPERCGKLNFLELIIKLELYLKKILEKEANNSKNKSKIILFDKCPIDNIVFIERTELDNILEKLQTSYDEIINSYDIIIHLETMAKDYQKLYNNANNENRTLDKNLAVERDNKILNAYNCSTSRRIINCCENIEDKQKKVVKLIEELLS